MDAISVLILTYLNRRYSIREIAAEIGKSICATHVRIIKLEEGGYVEKLTNKKARSRRLTNAGLDVLRQENVN
jgi:DNA-binding MarR family transcriptional regulator